MLICKHFNYKVMIERVSIAMTNAQSKLTDLIKAIECSDFTTFCCEDSCQICGSVGRFRFQRSVVQIQSSANFYKSEIYLLLYGAL